MKKAYPDSRGARTLRPARSGILAAVLLALAGMLPAGTEAAPLTTAFPGAVGYGKKAMGWRGGRVMAVNSLADSGAGTLRACAEAREPRVCIFRVSGTIALRTPLLVRSNVYIAGQTAPGNGIQLKMDNSTHGPMIVKNADHVVIRFLKLRPGVSVPSANVDALTIENSRNVYVGNVSMAFASDETLNIHVAGATASDITVANSVLAYSLDRANHPEGNHSKGALICSDEKTANQCGRITLARNLFAHHRDRNPDVKGTPIGPVEVINNIFYNPISQFGEFYDLLGNARIAYVGNLALTGPSTTARVASAVEAIDPAGGNTLGIFEQGNLAFRQGKCGSRVAMPILDPVARTRRVAAFALSFPPAAAAGLQASLPARVGDVLPGGRHRDALDQRVLNDLARCEGRVINSPADVGGWPVIPVTTGPVDTDRDLLPDAFETAHGLNPKVATAPWSDPDRDGVSVIETWLAVAAGDR